MISYAQNFEDVIINRIFGGKNTGFYVDVGAHFPVIDSVTEHFYSQGWSGINVEPLPSAFQELSKARVRDVNLNVAVSDTEGHLDFYMLDGLSTIASEISEAHRRLGRAARVTQVPCRTLKSIFEEHVVEDIDFLKIDVEGAEGNVIKGNDWARFRPKLIIVEAIDPVTALSSYEGWEPLLLRVDYEFIYTDGVNRYYWDSRLPSLPESMMHAPNVLDKVKTFTLLQAEAERAQAIRERDFALGELDRLKRQLESVFRSVFRCGEMAGMADEPPESPDEALFQIEKVISERNAELAEAKRALAGVHRALSAAESLASGEEKLAPSSDHAHRIESLAARADAAMVQCQSLERLLENCEKHRAVLLEEWEKREFGPVPDGSSAIA